MHKCSNVKIEAFFVQINFTSLDWYSMKSFISMDDINTLSSKVDTFESRKSTLFSTVGFSKASFYITLIIIILIMIIITWSTCLKKH